MTLLYYSSARRCRAHNKLLKCIRDRKIPKMRKQKNSPKKIFLEVEMANELIKADLSNITEQEFRIIVINIASLKKAEKTAENLLLQRSRD